MRDTPYLTSILVAVTLVWTALLPGSPAYATSTAPVPENTCGAEARATGTVTTDRGDIIFNDAPAQIRALHCVDVDTFDQAGCVAAYDVSVGPKRGCRLNFQLTRNPFGDTFSLGGLATSTPSGPPDLGPCSSPATTGAGAAGSPSCSRTDRAVRWTAPRSPPEGSNEASTQNHNPDVRLPSLQLG